MLLTRLNPAPTASTTRSLKPYPEQHSNPTQPASPLAARPRRRLQPATAAARAAACNPSHPCETRRPSSTTWCSRRPRGVDGDLLKLRLDPNSGSFGARIGSRLLVTPLFLACSYSLELMVVFRPANVLAQVAGSCPRRSSCMGRRPPT
jgi:hypothetical protein